jgi:hypothetical protein
VGQLLWHCSFVVHCATHIPLPPDPEVEDVDDPPVPAALPPLPPLPVGPAEVSRVLEVAVSEPLAHDQAAKDEKANARRTVRRCCPRKRGVEYFTAAHRLQTVWPGCHAEM